MNFLAEVWPLLSDETALRVYSWLCLSALLIVVGWNVRGLIGSLSEFSEKHLDKRHPGRDPSTEDGWNKRKDDLTTFKKEQSSQIAKQTGALLILGILLPGLTLGIIAFNEHWFLNGNPALSISDIPTPSSAVPVTSLITFVLDQALRGALSDLFEVFGLSATDLTNNVENLLFSSFVLAYRMICGIVVLTALYASMRLLKGRQIIEVRIKNARNQAALAAQ